MNKNHYSMRDARCPPAVRKQDPQVYLLFDVKCFSYLSLIYLSYRIPKSTNWSSEMHPESFKMGAKIGPKRPLGAALGGPRGLLGGSRGVQEVSWRGPGGGSPPPQIRPRCGQNWCSGGSRNFRSNVQNSTEPGHPKTSVVVGISGRTFEIRKNVNSKKTGHSKIKVPAPKNHIKQCKII